ncbi:MAG: NAD(P)/FAD-dependent oxidoreductase [Oscillospiraceae bacterium]|nr:NAD(P)/FAD-dependent oxidoreductase [Oscillospiraceae bacterium]
MAFEKLFSPMYIGQCEIKNRIVMEPMVLGTGTPRGEPGERMLDYYEARAKGGVGLILTEATRVDDSTGVLHPLQLAMSRDRHIAGFAALAERVHKHGAKLFCQLHHSGRQNYGLLMYTVALCQPFFRIPGFAKFFFWLAQKNDILEKTHLLPAVVAPSAVPCTHQKQKTKALTQKQIRRIIIKFAEAATRVQKAGGDGVELHGTHGYLIQQFLSPHTNRRTDAYGGSAMNRMRFLREIIEAIRARCGADFPIIVRLTVDEFYGAEGYGLSDGIQIAVELEKLGVAALDVSSGSYERMNKWLEPMCYPAGWRDGLAQAVKAAVHIPVIAANLTRTPEEAERKLLNGQQDFIGLGRPLLADPEWANKAAVPDSTGITRCISCLWCFESMLENAWKGKCGQCAVNPRTGRESEGRNKEQAVGGKTEAANGKKLACVIGAGIAGLSAAKGLAEDGCRVVVFEKEALPFGQLRLAAALPGKKKILWAGEDLLEKCRRLGVEFRYETAASGAYLKEMQPDIVVNASGATAVRPALAGGNLPHCRLVTEVLDGTLNPIGQTVVVVGSGMTGLETAEMLAKKGNRITVLEMADTLAPGAYHQHTEELLPHLEALGAVLRTSCKLEKVTANGCAYRDLKTGLASALAADWVILSLGVKPDKALGQELQSVFPGKVITLGDAAAGGRIAAAVNG